MKNKIFFLLIIFTILLIPNSTFAYSSSWFNFFGNSSTLVTKEKLGEGIFIPFTLDSTFQTSLHLKAKINGSDPIKFQLDTGSTGIVVSKDHAGNFDSKGIPGKITYSSSGRVLNGKWVMSTVEYVDSKGIVLIKSSVSILVVDNVTCLKNSAFGTCIADTNPKGISMMGVGFGRENDGMQQGTPEKNPFLNTEDMISKKIGRGYEIKNDGVILGINNSSSNGLQQIKLISMPNYSGDWSMPIINLILTIPNQKSITQNAILLADTGINSSLISSPGPTLKGLIPTGTKVEITATGTNLKWDFRTNEKSRFVKPHKQVDGKEIGFINTGLPPIGMIKYVYDADKGILGLKVK